MSLLDRLPENLELVLLPLVVTQLYNHHKTTRLLRLGELVVVEAVPYAIINLRVFTIPCVTSVTPLQRPPLDHQHWENTRKN
jgi:hypothetical protein